MWWALMKLARENVGYVVTVGLTGIVGCPMMALETNNKRLKQASTRRTVVIALKAQGAGSLVFLWRRELEKRLFVVGISSKPPSYFLRRYSKAYSYSKLSVHVSVSIDCCNSASPPLPSLSLWDNDLVHNSAHVAFGGGAQEYIPRLRHHLLLGRARGLPILPA